VENILDNFQLPQNVAEAGAREGIARMQMQSLDNGIQISGFKKDGIAYRFFWDTIYNHQKSLAAGYEKYDKTESVEFMVDKRTHPVYEVKFLSPDRLRFNLRGEPVGGTMFADYKRWKAGEEAPGTPLAKWEAIEPHTLRTLNSEGIFTIEQLAGMPRDRYRDIFRNNEEFMQLFERAILRQGNQQIAEKNAEQVQKLVAIAEENKKMREELEALKEQLKASHPVNKVEPKKAPSVKLAARDIEDVLNGK
jgi:hypothetical protein